MRTARILLIEDEPVILELLAEGLRKKGYEVLLARDGIEGFQTYEREKPDVVLTDIVLPGMKGTEVLRQIKGEDPEAKVIVMTGCGSEETAIEALRGGAINYLKKPIALRELYEIIEKATRIQDSEINREFVVEESKRIVMGNQIDKIWGVVNQLVMSAENVCKKAEIQELRLGLYEIIINAIEHGNLTITFEEKCQAIQQDSYQELLKERLSNPVYSPRRVTIDYHMVPGELHYIIKDEGRGFDPENPPCPDPSKNLLGPCGRGIFLTHIYLDRVDYNRKGNEVHLVKCGNREGGRDGRKATQREQKCQSLGSTSKPHRIDSGSVEKRRARGGQGKGG